MGPIEQMNMPRVMGGIDDSIAGEALAQLTHLTHGGGRPACFGRLLDIREREGNRCHVRALPQRPCPQVKPGPRMLGSDLPH